jgi:hypothetical protein
VETLAVASLEVKRDAILLPLPSLIFKDLVFTHVHEFIFLFFYIASMTRFVEIFRKLFELRLAIYTFFQK